MIYIFARRVMNSQSYRRWKALRTFGKFIPRAFAPRGARPLCLALLCCACWAARVPLARAQTGARPLPQAAGAERQAGRVRVPLIGVGPGGELSLDGSPAGTLAAPGRLTKRLAELFRRREGAPGRRGARHATAAAVQSAGSPGRAVIIMAPSSARYNTVAGVIEAAKKAGAGTVKLVHDSEQLLEARRELAEAADAPRTDEASPGPGAPAEVPAPSADPGIVKESSVVVSIAPDNNLYIGHRLVPPGELEAEVRALTAGTPEAERVVYVRAHLDAPYQLVVDVIERVRRAGVRHIGLVTDKRARE